MESGVHLPLHSSCHHQIIYARFNLKIYYPSPYKNKIRYYKKANINLIQQAIREFKEREIYKLILILEMKIVLSKKKLLKHFRTD